MAVEEESLQGESPGGVNVTLSEVPRFHTLGVRTVVQGHKVGVLIDWGKPTTSLMQYGWLSGVYKQRNLKDSP